MRFEEDFLDAEAFGLGGAHRFGVEWRFFGEAADEGEDLGADGSLTGEIASEARSGSAAIANSEVVLIAHFLGLLVTFIGVALTLRLVQDAWPKASLDDLEVEKGHSK